MLTASTTSFDPTWYSDSGVTNYITSDLSNLTNKIIYVGPDQIHIGDGIGLDIHRVGTSSFQSKFNSKVLTLNNLMHVPSFTKNLISVSKFS